MSQYKIEGHKEAKGWYVTLTCPDGIESTTGPFPTREAAKEKVEIFMELLKAVGGEEINGEEYLKRISATNNSNPSMN